MQPRLNLNSSHLNLELQKGSPVPACLHGCACKQPHGGITPHWTALKHIGHKNRRHFLTTQKCAQTAVYSESKPLSTSIARRCDAKIRWHPCSGYTLPGTVMQVLYRQNPTTTTSPHLSKRKRRKKSQWTFQGYSEVSIKGADRMLAKAILLKSFQIILLNRFETWPHYVVLGGLEVT